MFSAIFDLCEDFSLSLLPYPLWKDKIHGYRWIGDGANNFSKPQLDLYHFGRCVVTLHQKSKPESVFCLPIPSQTVIDAIYQKFNALAEINFYVLAPEVASTPQNLREKLQALYLSWNKDDFAVIYAADEHDEESSEASFTEEFNLDVCLEFFVEALDDEEFPYEYTIFEDYALFTDLNTDEQIIIHPKLGNLFFYTCSPEGMWDNFLRKENLYVEDNYLYGAKDNYNQLFIGTLQELNSVIRSWYNHLEQRYAWWFEDIWGYNITDAIKATQIYTREEVEHKIRSDKFFPKIQQGYDCTMHCADLSQSLARRKFSCQNMYSTKEHTFLLVRIAEDEVLIIDPTAGQFLRNYRAPLEYYNEIFVGTTQELYDFGRTSFLTAYLHPACYFRMVDGELQLVNLAGEAEKKPAALPYQMHRFLKPPDEVSMSCSSEEEEREQVEMNY